MIDVKKLLPLLGPGSLAIAACLVPAGTALADVKAGVDAWSAGDYAAAVREWQPLADRGDADAQFNLAQAYKLGRGMPVNLEKARELYGKAAAQGHVQAADTYGLLLFQNGERERALPYLLASSERGEPRAQYILGVAHFNGDIIAKDWVRAYALVTLARNAGLPQATNALAQMDSHIPLADRQQGVALSSRIAAEAEATQARVSTAAELGPVAATPPAPPPPIVTASPSATPPVRTAGPAAAGADFTRQTPPAVRKPAPAPAPAVVAAPPKPAPKPAPKPVPAGPAGAWRVQLGAFGVVGNADALWAKVRGRPELSGHGKVFVPTGKLTKLQAGGFASRAAAEAACTRLAAGGFACLPVQD